MNKVEMLPWDKWGRMTEAYEGRTGPDYAYLRSSPVDRHGGCAAPSGGAWSTRDAHARYRSTAL